MSAASMPSSKAVRPSDELKAQSQLRTELVEAGSALPTAFVTSAR